MTAQPPLKVVTAHTLLKGDAVWLTFEDGWTRDFDKAEIIEGEGLALRRLSMAQSQTDMVIDPYLAEIRLGQNGPYPAHFREAFRARGPSNYAHGKQEAITKN